MSESVTDTRAEGATDAEATRPTVGWTTEHAPSLLAIGVLFAFLAVLIVVSLLHPR